MTEVLFKSPLQWVLSQPRTRNPSRARFKTDSTYRSGLKLVGQLKTLKATNIVVSTNLQVKSNNTFYANQRIEDNGVVVYFTLKGKHKAMACDKWDRVEHNLWSLYLSIEAIRGLERWGGSDFLDGLFSGFTALPSPESAIVMNQEKDYFFGYNTKEERKQRYLDLIKEYHPDKNDGNDTEFVIIKRQYESFVD